MHAPKDVLSCGWWSSWSSLFTQFLSAVFLSQMTLRHEDGDEETQLPPSIRKDRRRASVGGTNERRGLERRRSRRHSLQNSRGHASAPASPSSPHTHASSFLPFGGQRVEDISERWGKGRIEMDGKEKKWKILKKRNYTISLLPFELELGLMLVLKGSARRICFDLVYFKPWEIAATTTTTTKRDHKLWVQFDCKCCIIFQPWRDASTQFRAKADNLIR